MKLSLLIFAITVCSSISQQIPGTRQYDDRGLARQDVSYSTSVLHHNPEFPDQSAQSTVNVDLYSAKPVANRENTSYQQPLGIRSSKSIPNYQPPMQAIQSRPQQTLQARPHQTRMIHGAQDEYSSPTPEQSQSFNVGYSVSFTGPPKRVTRQKLPEGDVITGTRKDFVDRPGTNFDPQEFVVKALLDGKLQKMLGSKSKHTKRYPDENQDAQAFLTNLSPKTIHSLAVLEQQKPIPNNVKFQKVPEAAPLVQTPNAWKSLSPSVEIYHSKDVPLNPQQRFEQSKKFDHAGALGKSQGFDYSNAIDTDSEKSPKTLKDSKKDFDVKAIEDYYKSFDAPQPIVVFNKPGSVSALQAAQTQAVNGLLEGPTNVVSVTAFHPQLHGPGAKLPIDTSLLRTPVLSENPKNVPNDPMTIAIPFDTTLLQAMQRQLASYAEQPGQVYAVSKDQGYRGRLETLQPMQSVHPVAQIASPDFQIEQAQEMPMFDIYGKFPSNTYPDIKQVDPNFEKLFGKSKLKLREVRPDGGIRQSRYITRMRSKDYEMHTDLRPPPVKIPARRRRTFNYN